MKHKYGLLGLALCAALFIPATLFAGNITFTWTDPNPPGTVKVFRIYTAPSITTPIQMWNAAVIVSGSQSTCSIAPLPGTNYFAIVAQGEVSRSEYSAIIEVDPVVIVPVPVPVPVPVVPVVLKAINFKAQVNP
jgi:hypothetical protein